MPNETKQKIANLIFHIPETSDFNWIEDLKSKMIECSRKPERHKIWLISPHSCSGGIGLFNCLKREIGGDFLRLISNESMNEGSLLPFQQLVSSSSALKGIFRKDLTMNIYRDGEWGLFSYRAVPKCPMLQPRDKIFLNMSDSRNETQLEWTELKPDKQSSPPLKTKPKNVTIYYATINIRDLMFVSKQLSTDPQSDRVLGMEFSGVDDDGRRVMGVASSQAMASCITLPSPQLLEVPDSWTLEEAASVPFAYLTAYYGLIVKGRLKNKSSLLIHCDSGGLGFAATSIALSMNCEVFLTVDSPDKKKLMQAYFPELEDHQICCSQTEKFETLILNSTKGVGVNVVLNTLENSGFKDSISCLRAHGNIVDIRYQTSTYDSFGMGELKKNCTIHGAVLSHLFEDNKNARNELIICTNMLKEGIQKKTVRPIPYKIFQWNEAKEAFAFLDSGMHTGKVILKIRDEEANVTPTQVTFDCVLKTYFHPGKSYIVVGDLRGIAFEMVKWMIAKGAKNVIMSSEGTDTTEYEKLWFQRWREQGANVTLSKHSSTTAEGTKSLIEEAGELLPVHGIFHAYTIFQNEWLTEITPTQFQAIWNITAHSVRNLDRISRKRCPELSYFTLFSSLTSVTGMSGRSCLAFCCSAMERVIERRKHQGLPGIAIQFGPIGDVGADFENMGRNHVVINDCASQKLISCLAVLDRILQENYTVVSSYIPLNNGSCPDVVPDQHLDESFDESSDPEEILQTFISKKKSEKRDHSIIKQPQLAKQVLVSLNSHESCSRLPKCLFFVHPLEGHVGMLEELGRRFKFPVYGLQFTSEVPYESIQDIAQYYVKQMKSVQRNGPYHLCGLSFGSLIAFEIAQYLQSTDKVQTFICIDGTPESVRELSKLWFGDQKQDQNNPLAPYMMMVKTVSDQVTEEVEQYLQNNIVNSSMDDVLKVDKLQTLLGIEVSGSIVEEILFLNKRIAAATACYEPSGILQGKALSIRFYEPTQKKMPAVRSDEDLKKYFAGPVEVITLNCSKTQALEEKASSLATVISSRVNN